MPTNNITIGIDARPAKRGASDAKRSFDIVRDSAKSATAGVTNTSTSFNQLSSHALSLRTALLGLAGVMGTGFAMRDLRSSLAQFEDLQSVLAITTGSMQQAGVEYEFLSDSANRLGLCLTDLQSGYVRLTAATQNTTLAGAATREAFLAVGEASASMGLSTEKTTRALDTLSMMAERGTVQTRILRDQFGVAIPGAFGATAKAMGLTNEEFEELLDSGSVLSKDLIPMLTTALRDLHGEAASDNINSLNGSMAVLENTIGQLKLEIGEGGLKQAFVDFNRTLIDTLSGNDQLAQQIGGALSTGLNALGTTIKLVADNFNLLKFAAMGWLAVISAHKITAIGNSLTGYGVKVLALSEAQKAATITSSGAAIATTGFGKAANDASFKVAALTNRTRTARVAVLGLNGALGLLGGPLGILALTGYSLYQLAQSVGTVRDAQLSNIDSLEATKSLYSDLHLLSEQAISDNLAEASSILEKAKAEQIALKARQEELLNNTPLNPNSNTGILGFSAINATQRNDITSEFSQQILEASAQITEAEKALEALTDAQTQRAEQTLASQVEQTGIVSANVQKQIDAYKLETEQLAALQAAYGEGEQARAALITQHQAQIAIQQLGIEANSEEAHTLAELIEQRNILTESLRQLDVEEQERLRLLEQVKSPLDQLMAQERRLIELRQADLVSLSEYSQALKEINREKLYFSTDGMDGFKRALLDYQDELEDTAYQTESLLSNAFKGAEDALTDFVTTGKLSFSDFAESVLKDIARIALQQTLMKGLMSFIPGVGLASAVPDIAGSAMDTTMQGMNEQPSFEPTSIAPLTMAPMTAPSPQQSPVNINTTVNVSSPAGLTPNQNDPEQAKLLANEISQTIKAEVVQIIYEQQRPGGALYK